jgi:flagellar basal-body rod protein FlgB
VSIDLTSGFDAAQRVMDFTSARARALNTNLAHASEPGYHRVDVDFATLAKALRADDAARREVELAKVRPQAVADPNAVAGSNGNNVNFETEQVQMDKNGLLHQLATVMVTAHLQQMRAAISGRS